MPTVKLGQSWKRANTPARDPWASVATRLTTARVERLASALEALGLKAWASPLRAALARHAQVTSATEEAAKRLADAKAELARAVADGRLAPGEAAVAYQEAARGEPGDGVAEDMAHRARRQILADAVQPLYESHTELLDDLDGVVRAQAQRVAKAATACEGIARDDDAARAPKKARDAWFEVAEARLVIEGAHQLADRLRLEGITEGFPHRYMDSRYWRHHAADRVEATPDTHPSRRLLIQVAAGAEPGVLAAAEIVERYIDAPEPEDAA